MYIDGCVIYDILTLCMYNFLCVIVSVKMTKHLLKHVGGLTRTNNLYYFKHCVWICWYTQIRLQCMEWILSNL